MRPSQSRTSSRSGSLSVEGQTLLWCLFALLLFGSFTSASAQTFQVQGGASSLFQADGGSFKFWDPKYQGWVGAGNLAGQFRMGAFLQTQLRNHTLSFGDETIPFELPTDIFDGSHYFWGRGAGVSGKFDGFDVFAFAGATSSGFGAPFFQGARAERGAGLLFLTKQIKPSLGVFSRTVLSSRQTILNALEWRPRSSLRVGLTGGLGADEKYLASSLALDREWISLKAAYVLAGDQFRRVIVQTPLTAESDRENILVTLRPTSYLSLGAGRQNLLEPVSLNANGPRATLDRLSASATAAQFTLAGVLYESRVQNARVTGQSLSLGRDITNRVQVSSSLYHSRPARGPSTTSVLSTIREALSPRLDLTQLVNHSGGNTSLSLGGHFYSNRFSIGVEYQTVYVPFRTANPFKQVLMLNVQMQPFGNYQFTLASLLAPDGKVKYTASGSTVFSRAESDRPTATTFSFPKYIVQGRVTDEQGVPIRGVSVRVDGDIVFTDSEGRFFVRKKHPRVYKLEVLPSESLAMETFEIASAPASAEARPDGEGLETIIILRRLQPHSP